MKGSLFGFDSGISDDNSGIKGFGTSGNGSVTLDKIEFRGKIDRNIQKVRAKNKGKKKGVVGISVTAVSLLLLGVFCLFFKDFFGENNASTVIIGLLVVAAVGILIAVKGFFMSAGSRTIKKNDDLSIVFDKTARMVIITPLDNNGKKIAIPFSQIDGYNEFADYYEVIYDVPSKNKKRAEKNKATFRTAKKSFVCQKNLLVSGTATDFVRTVTELSETKMAADKQIRNKFSWYAVSSIIISVIAVALSYPLIMLASSVFEYINGLFTASGSAMSCEEWGIEILFFIPKVLYAFILGIFGVYCYISPFPLLIISLRDWIRQIRINRRWFSVLAIVVWCICLIGSIVIAVLCL